MRERTVVATIQDFTAGNASVHVRSPDVLASISRSRTSDEECTLGVEFPAETSDPAGRDVWCDVMAPDWRRGRAIALDVLSNQALRLSMSFMARNGVAYTTWLDVPGGGWQFMEIALAGIEPNPYFQPPAADPASPMDLSEVRMIGFAPQIPGPGKFSLKRIMVVA